MIGKQSLSQCIAYGVTTKKQKPIVKNTNLKGICWYNAPAAKMARVYSVDNYEIINETVLTALIVRLCNISPYAVNDGFNKKKQQQEIFLLFLEQVLPVYNLELLGGLRVAYHFIRGDIRGGL